LLLPALPAPGNTVAMLPATHEEVSALLQLQDATNFAGWRRADG